MKLAAYLQRIGFEGRIECDLATLERVHLAHQLSIPFENLDVQLQRRMQLDTAAAFDKIALRGRGGWCYEMNGLLGWALTEMGYSVRRLSGGVMREQRGDTQLGNHLCLLVSLDQPYLVDVGFGGSLLRPLPLQPAAGLPSPPYCLSLASMADDYWRFTERAQGAGLSFDFRTSPADEALLASQCLRLQTDPNSSFVQNLVVQRRTLNQHISLRGRVLTVLSTTDQRKMRLESAQQLVQALAQYFDLHVPEAASLWPAICERHASLFGPDR